MNALKRGLGSNLSALGLKELVSSINTKPAPISNEKSATLVEGLSKLPIEFMRPGKYQPRRVMNEEFLQELATSISTQGIIQPIVVRPLENNSYEIIAGERRWRAAQIAGLKEVPVIVRTLSDREAVAIALIENLQREDLNAIDAAYALDRLSKEFELTHQEVADTVGKSRVAVTNLLRLLNLAQIVQDMLKNGELAMGHARALLALPEIKQVAAAKLVAQKKMSVRETERLVNSWLLDLPNAGQRAQRKVDPNIIRLENDLKERIGAKVALKTKGKSKGQVVIYYNSLDELDNILGHIKN